MQEDMVAELIGMAQPVLAFEQPRAAHRHDAFAEQLLHDEAGIAPAAIADRDVDIAGREVDELHGGGDPHVDLGIGRLKAVEARQQPFAGEGRRDAHRQHAAPPDAADPRHRGGDALERRADAGKADLGRVGQRQHPIGAVEQGDAEIGLEHLHLVADRGRRDVELVARPDEAQVTRCHLEAAERIERRQPRARLPGVARSSFGEVVSQRLPGRGVLSGPSARHAGSLSGSARPRRLGPQWNDGMAAGLLAACRGARVLRRRRRITVGHSLPLSGRPKVGPRSASLKARKSSGRDELCLAAAPPAHLRDRRVFGAPAVSS